MVNEMANEMVNEMVTTADSDSSPEEWTAQSVALLVGLHRGSPAGAGERFEWTAGEDAYRVHLSGRSFPDRVPVYGVWVSIEGFDQPGVPTFNFDVACKRAAWLLNDATSEEPYYSFDVANA
jgi:hypothetical protein